MGWFEHVNMIIKEMKCLRPIYKNKLKIIIILKKLLCIQKFYYYNLIFIISRSNI